MTTCRPKFCASLTGAIPATTSFFKNHTVAILWQNAQPVLDVDLTNPKELIATLKTFFSHRPPEYTDWEEAVAQFKTVVPELGKSLANLIQSERETNARFKAAFADFYEKCRQAINPKPLREPQSKRC